MEGLQRTSASAHSRSSLVVPGLWFFPGTRPQPLTFLCQQVHPSPTLVQVSLKTNDLLGSFRNFALSPRGSLRLVSPDSPTEIYIVFPPGDLIHFRFHSRNGTSSSTLRRFTSRFTSFITGSLPYAPVPTTSRRHFQGMFSSMERGVCPNSSRNCLDSFFLRSRISLPSITTS